MRLLITADLHYDSLRSRKAAGEMIARILATGGDALVLAGDTAGPSLDVLRECLAQFRPFPGRKFLVMGNHCLWCRPGENSIERYERLVPEAAAEEGFECLDQAPAVLGAVGLAGSVGWYDYSYREAELGIPIEFYQAKVAPGAANRLAEHRLLYEQFEGELGEEQRGNCTRWMDGVHARLGMTDEAFLDIVVERLHGHLRQLSDTPGVQRIIACTHHVPFAQLVPRSRPAAFAFAAAYMGSDRIGRAIREFPKVTHVFCGHSHWPGRVRLDGLDVVNVGSTYLEKHLEVLEI